MIKLVFIKDGCTNEYQVHMYWVLIKLDMLQSTGIMAEVKTAFHGIFPVHIYFLRGGNMNLIILPMACQFIDNLTSLNYFQLDTNYE